MLMLMLMLIINNMCTAVEYLEYLFPFSGGHRSPAVVVVLVFMYYYITTVITSALPLGMSVYLSKD